MITRWGPALQRVLCSYGYTVDIVGSGEAALAYLARCRPRLVLLDVMMPGLNGTEVLRIVRASPDLSNIPIVFYTAGTTPDNDFDARKLGASALLRKGAPVGSILSYSGSLRLAVPICLNDVSPKTGSDERRIRR